MTQYPNPMQYPNAAMPPQMAPKAPGLASLILGIVGLFTCGLTAIVGLILGIVAMGKASRTGAPRGMAVAGTVVSAVVLVIGLVMLVVVMAIIVPAAGAASNAAKMAVVQTNMKRLHYALRSYSVEHDRLPPAAELPDVLDDYAGDDAEELMRIDGQRILAFNSRVFGFSPPLAVEDPPSDTALLFECRPGSPMVGRDDLVPDKPRFSAGYLVLFADGSVRAVSREELLDAIRFGGRGFVR